MYMFFLYGSKKFLVFVIILFFIMIAFYSYTVQPLGDKSLTRTVDIPSGAGFFGITEILNDAGFVKNRPFFWALAIGKGAARQIKAGEYEFSENMSPAEIINKLIRGERKYYVVLIPEDLSAREIAQRLVSLKLINEKEFMKLVTDHDFILSLGLNEKSLEGYLFPDTYRLDRSMTTASIIRILVNRFKEKITPEITKRAGKMKMTLHQLITLASIIGKESASSTEKPLISAVFHNRMKLRMKLQSDPTTIYGLQENGNDVKTVLARHLKSDNPYNTYRIKGLPPGPIANPGLDSIMAALYPANNKYLYFVSKNDGTHQFSTDLAGHKRAIQEYRKKIKIKYKNIKIFLDKIKITLYLRSKVE
jgi:UPF0755 protein